MGLRNQRQIDHSASILKGRREPGSPQVAGLCQRFFPIIIFKKTKGLSLHLIRKGAGKVPSGHLKPI